MSNFLFPIETTARELDHKILMAILAAKEGRNIFVGDQQIIRTLSFLLKGGVFYGKHLFGKPSFSDKTYYNRLKSRGFKLVHLNEEGAVWPGKEFEWKNILKQCERPSQLSKDDFLATWGRWQKEFNESYEPTEATICTTGHPRFDLYSERYRRYFLEDTKKINDDFGDFILINTAFSYSNNGEGGVGFIFKPNVAYDTNNEDHRKYRFKRWKQQMFSIADIVDLVNKISLVYPDKKIVIRPHPSEDSSYYESIFQNIDNVSVVYKGAVTPWILACKLMIHNGCTTAIEATLANKPVINYSTNPDPDFDVYLANICGFTTDCSDEALNYVERAYQGSINVMMPKDKFANSLFHNFETDQSCYEVIQLLSKADELNNNSSTTLSNINLKLVGLYHELYLFFKYSYLSFVGRNKDAVDYKKRFEKFDEIDISNRVNLLSKILKISVKVKFVSRHVFVITKDL
ncbi:surface carbohydrate biosynthesis protein [Vibrio cyclitrophicus]|uniref:surface carbohydrate biosynthesis protein n=1 Tax=Vibrio cyclitrophicus TaxID=47951 RepID=UPI0035A7304D